MSTKSLKNTLLFTSLIILIASCQSEFETIEIEDESGHVVERYQIQRASGLKHGLYNRFKEDGELLETSNYDNNILQGERLLYHYDSSYLNIKENYENGILMGDFFTYNHEGQVLFHATYVKTDDGSSMMQGDALSYYATGTLKEKVHMENNLENGPFEEYHPNGKIATRGTYSFGDKEHGLLEIFDEQGELTKTMDCDHGLCFTKWEKEK